MRPSFPRAATRLSAVAALAVFVLTLAQAARAQTPGSLNSEILTRNTFGSDRSAFNVTNLNCTQGGAAGFDFTSSGFALGPYPGTYTESGSVTFENAPGGVILSFSSQFTITSGATVITGTKQLAPAQPPLGNNNRGICQVLQDGNFTTTNASVIVAAQYTATIPTATGTITETGTSRVNAGSGQVVSSTGGSGGNFSFNETYRNVGITTAVTLTPAADANPIRTVHGVVATALNAAGEGVYSVDIYLDVTADGSTVHSSRCRVNDGTGECRFFYVGPQWPRSDTIRACADRDDNGRIDPTDPCATATKGWVFPASTPGAATGGGQLLDNQTQSDGVIFAFGFRGDDGRPAGTCNVSDKTSGISVKCENVMSYVQAGNTATAYGTAELNGVQTYYKIVVTDNGEPDGRDTFTLTTQSGYTVGGTVTQGNIQVHPPQ